MRRWSTDTAWVSVDRKKVDRKVAADGGGVGPKRRQVRHELVETWQQPLAVREHQVQVRRKVRKLVEQWAKEGQQARQQGRLDQDGNMRVEVALQVIEDALRVRRELWEVR